MSSLVSLQPADYQGALLAAVTQVAENSLFAFADASDEGAFEEATTTVHTGAADWLRARIQFTGFARGHFELTMPTALAYSLCVAFAGASGPDEISDGDLSDFSGELANMMCGGWLTRIRQHEAFNLAAQPVRRDGPDTACRPAAPPTAKRVYLALDDTPIRLEIEWNGTQASGEGPADGR